METNFEHYKDELLKMYICGCSKCDFIIENILSQENFSCQDISCATCSSNVKDWLEKPYEEPKPVEIDWSKVPPDTRVIVSQVPLNSLPGDKQNRYFAKFDPKGDTKYPFLCYDGGATSWSGKEDELFGWKYCELADPADIEKYKK